MPKAKEIPCPHCGARKPKKNGHHWGCPVGKDKGGKK